MIIVKQSWHLVTWASHQPETKSGSSKFFVIHILKCFVPSTGLQALLFSKSLNLETSMVTCSNILRLQCHYHNTVICSMCTSVGTFCFSSEEVYEIYPNNCKQVLQKTVSSQHFCCSVMFTSVLGFIFKQFCGERGQADCIFYSIIDWSKLCPSYVENLP